MVPVQIQLDFLNQIQGRLLDSQVQTSYKYALLHAIADLSVQLADNSVEAPLILNQDQLVGAWLALYKRQAKPYPVRSTYETKQVILSQSNTSGRSILDLIDDYQIDKISERELLGEIKKRVKNPITRLYPGESSHDNFLYSFDGSVLALKPYVAYCFKEHYDLVIGLIRDRWLTFIRQSNQSIIGENTELNDFLFGAQRSSLSPYYNVLSIVYEPKCFYCQTHEDKIRSNTSDTNKKLAVDHFIPWSKYSVDLAHNFVFACESCNSSKSDNLASLGHVARWMDLLRTHGEQVSEICIKNHLACDLKTSRMIASWAYTRHLKLGGELWLKPKSFQSEPLTSFEQIFNAH